MHVHVILLDTCPCHDGMEWHANNTTAFIATCTTQTRVRKIQGVQINRQFYTINYNLRIYSLYLLFIQV